MFIPARYKCDNCGTTLVVETLSISYFESVGSIDINHPLPNGWEELYEEDNIYHYCSECKEK